MDDGDQAGFGPGDVMICPPGHDAWVVGDVPCAVIDWGGYAGAHPVLPGRAGRPARPSET